MEGPALTASALPEEVPWGGRALPGKDLCLGRNGNFVLKTGPLTGLKLAL